MSRKIRRLTAVLLVSAASSAVIVIGSSAAASGGVEAERDERSGVRAFVQARIFDGTGAPVIEEGVVVVRDGIITAVGRAGEVQVPAEAEVVDVGGRWLVPGLVNAHGHVRGDRGAAQEQLDLYAYYGVTTVISLGDEAPDFRAERTRPELRTARLYVSGPSVSPGTPEEARATVADLAARNVDWVKTHLNPGGQMPAPAVDALIGAARDRGLPVAGHVEALEPARNFVHAGGALVAHSVRDVPVDQGFIDLLRERDVCLVPTFTRELSTFVYRDRPDFFDDPFFRERAAPDDLEAFLTPQLQAQSRNAAAERWRQALPLAMDNMRRLHEGGVQIAMGTDTGPTGRFQGYFEHVELEMMVEGGLSPREVLVAATGGAARCVGLGGVVGTIEPGAWADLLIVEQNPLEDVRHLRSIRGVWISGNAVRGG